MSFEVICKKLTKLFDFAITKYEDPKEIIEKAVAKALCNYKSIKPLKADEKITVSTTFYRTDMCEDALEKAKFPCIRIDARTLERTLMKSEIYSYYQLVF